MLVTNTTHLTGSEVEKVLVKAYKNTQLSKVEFYFFFLIAGLTLVIFGYAMNHQLYKITGFGSLAISVGIFFLWFHLIKSAPKKLMQNNGVEMQSGVKYDYTFREQSFQVISKSLSGSRKGNYKYDDIKRVYINLDSYLFKMRDNHYMVVKNEGFESDRMISFFDKDLEINKVKITDKRPKKN